MPFIWKSEPNLPAAVPPVVIAPEEVSSKVHVVANTVNVGGAVSYNTPNVGFDVVYEIDSLNVRNLRVLTGNFVTANIGTATINTATILQATINTANITNATINIGYFTGNATANFSMVNKQYVDNAIANISGGSGPDTTANIILQKGDLLVGFAPNTAHRLGVGTDGKVLIVDTSNPLKQRWANASSTQSVVGLHIGTHYHPVLKNSQVLLRHVDGIIMNDGESVTGWDGLVADITVSGAGGLDSNSTEAANTWYEVWAIRNSTSGSKALLLHRMLNRPVDQTWPATASQSVYLRRGEPGLTIPAMRYLTKISQSFVPQNSPIRGIEVLASRITAMPNTADIWVSLQGDDGTGNADGSIISTSESNLFTYMGGGTNQMHFAFDTAVPVTPGGRYHMVFEGDWPIGPDSNSISIALIGNTAPLGPGQQSWMANVGYTSGNLIINSGYGDCRIYNGVTNTWMVAANATGVESGPQDLFFKTFVESNDTALALPSGYNQKALISYVCNNGSSNFKEYHQLGRVMTMGYDPDWRSYTTDGSVVINIIPVHFDATVPPTPCTIQLMGISPSQLSAFVFSQRTTFSSSTSAVQDVPMGPDGTYVFGIGGLKQVLSRSMSIDELQILNLFTQSVANIHFYLVNITF